MDGDRKLLTFALAVVVGYLVADMMAPETAAQKSINPPPAGNSLPPADRPPPNDAVGVPRVEAGPDRPFELVNGKINPVGGGFNRE